jgi:hypothetical protein
MIFNMFCCYPYRYTVEALSIMERELFVFMVEPEVAARNADVDLQIYKQLIKLQQLYVKYTKDKFLLYQMATSPPLLMFPLR